MPSKSKVMIVDDDGSIRETLTDYLDAQGFTVASAADHQSALRLAKSLSPDIAIIELAQNGGGLALFLELRSFSSVPVIFLTEESEESDCIISLEIGGDDYLTKPCNPRELTARIKAVLRRTNPASDKPVNLATVETLSFGHCHFNSSTHELTKATGETVMLSKGERKLLMTFLANPKTVMSREHLLDATQNRRKDIYDRSVDNLVSRLRKKLEVDPHAPRLIKTYWGGGYSLTSDVTAASDVIVRSD